MDEIPPLQSVLEYQRRSIVQTPGAEDGCHASEGVRECLARPVDIEKPESRRRNTVGCANLKTHLLLISLVDGVHRGRGQRFCFIGRNWLKRISTRVAHLPVAGRQLRLVAKLRADQ